MKTQSWGHLDKKETTIYLNLNSEGGKIVKLAPDAEPELVENEPGLITSGLIKPFQYNPSTSEAEGFARLKTLLMDTAPMELSQRYFLLCWAISSFLVPYFSDRLLLQIFGNAGSGKSQIMARLSMLFNGDVFCGQTIAAAGRMAGTDPVIFMDNVDSRKLNAALPDFLLFMANSAQRPMAKQGNDTEVKFQKLNALCMITSIEPFPEKYPELINRTYQITTSRDFKNGGYEADSVLIEIQKQRDRMLSAIFKTLGKKVLPRLAQNIHPAEDRWYQYVKRNFHCRNKQHLNIIITILAAILDYLPLIGPKNQSIDDQILIIVDQWVKKMKADAI